MSERKYKILHISTAKSWRGGEQQALYLMRGLRESGHENIVATQPGSPMAERAREAGIRVEEVKMRGEWDLLAVLGLRSLVKLEGVQIVHAHDAHGVSLAARAGKWGGAHRVCTRRVDFKLNSPGKYRNGMEWVICISEAIKRICLDADVTEEKMSVVPSGIDVSRIADIKSERERIIEEFCPEEKKPRIILNVASLTDHKGQKYLLEAMPEVLAKVPRAHLIIVGTGELENDLKRQANLLAINDRVTFAGFREDVPQLLKSAELFVMSSHLEGLCTSIMDAMAAGLPVVASRAGGIPELITEGQTGVLVPPQEPDALASAMIDLLENRKKHEHFSRNAVKYAAKHFDYHNMVNGTVSVYAELMGDSVDG